MKKLSNTDAELRKSVAYKKSVTLRKGPGRLLNVLCTFRTITERFMYIQDVYWTFYVHSGRLLNVLCTFNLRLASRETLRLEAITGGVLYKKVFLKMSQIS